MSLPVLDMLSVPCLTPFMDCRVSASFCTSFGFPLIAIISRQFSWLM